MNNVEQKENSFVMGMIVGAILVVLGWVVTVCVINAIKKTDEPPKAVPCVMNTEWRHIAGSNEITIIQVMTDHSKNEVTLPKSTLMALKEHYFPEDNTMPVYQEKTSSVQWVDETTKTHIRIISREVDGKEHYICMSVPMAQCVNGMLKGLLENRIPNTPLNPTEINELRKIILDKLSNNKESK